MRRFTLKAAALAGVLLASALLPALAQSRGPGIVGDVNGDGRITSADALAVYAYLAGRPVPASFDVPGRGDADGDGRITRQDAELIMRVAVGKAAPDRPVGKPADPNAAPAEGPIRVQCVATVQSQSVSCAGPTPGGAQADAITYGGQHVYVSLLTSDVTVVADTFAFDMAVKNLIPQAIGTTDGTTVDPVMVFFAAGIQSGNASVSAANHDGARSFTTGEPQKYFSYPEIIQPQATSSKRRWKLHIPTGTQNFTFTLYVNSPVVYPRGWVDVYPKAAEISAGATLQLSDTVRNPLGRPIPSTRASWTSSNTAIATVDANGIVTAVTDGTVQITGSSDPRAPGTMTLTVSSAALDSSRITAAPATLPVRDTATLTVQLRNSAGAPITRSGGTVVLTADAGTLGAVTDNQDGTYTAKLTHTVVDTVKVGATLNGAALRDTVQVGFTAGAPAAYRVTSSADTVAAGSPVTITAQTVDAVGNPAKAAGATVTWTSTGGGTFASPTSTTNSDGAAQVVFTTATTAGVTHTVTATDGASLTGTSGNIVTGAGTAAKLVFTQAPSNAAAGTAIAPAVTVAIQDANGNTVASSDSVALTLGTNPAAGTLSGTARVAAVNGVATFSTLSVDKAGTGYTLAASSGALPGVTSSAFDITAGAASQLTLTTQPSSTAQSGVPFARQPVVQLRDANGNAVPQAGVVVTAALASGSGTVGGSATANTDASGVATFTDLAISGAVGDRTLSFSAGALTAATSGTITLAAGTASQLTINTQPSAAAQSGVAFAQQPVVQLRDAAGNVVAQAGVTVTAALASGGGTLGGTATATTDAGGVATFTDLSITGATGDRTLSFSAAGLTGATSGTISLGAGAASQLTITTQPSAAAQSGAAFAQQPVVQLRDASGNAVGQAGVTVTAAIASGGGALGGTATATTDAGGVATFTDLSISGTVGDRTLSFAAAGLTGANSSTISVGAGAASQLIITTQPSSTAQSGAAFAQQPVVQLYDASGNAVGQAGVTVTAAIASGGGTLGGTVTAQTNASGVATFTDLSISGTVGDRTLSFSAGGLTGATSGTVGVTAGAASQLIVTTQPSDSVQSGAAFPRQPSVQLRDAGGNAVSQAGVTVTAVIASGGGTLGGTTTAQTNSSGVAAFADLSITGTIGDRTLSFSATGLTGATSSSLHVRAGAASQLAIATQPSSSAQAGAPFAQQPTIRLQDASGNWASQAGVTVTAAIASGGGTLGGTVTAQTNASGVATFTDLSISGTVGDRTLSFSAGGLTGATSGTVGVTAGAAAALGFTVQPSNAVASAAITPAVQVSIVDAFGNVTASTASVTVAIGTNPSGGTLSGTATASAVNGVASFSDLSINLTGTGYTLAASSGSLTGATSGAFSVTHGPLHHFVVEQASGGPIGSQLAGTPFNVRVTAQDEYNNTVTNFTGTTAFTSTPGGGISAGAASGAFTAGVLSSHSITFGTAGSFTLTATNSAGAQSGTSNSFDVQAPPTAVNEGPAANSSPGQPFHAFYSTSGSPQTFNLAAPGVLSNDNLGFPAATITSFGADSLGGSVTTYAAGSTVSPLPGTGRTTGSLSVGADGTVTFTPPDGFTGNYVFQYRLTNARGTSDGRVTIAVGARPSAVNDTYSPQLVGNVPINTASSTQFRVTTNDAGDRKILAITGQSNGTATLNADSTFTFRPTAGHSGSASFTYTVTNGFGTSAPATVSMTVGTPIWFVNAAAGTGGDGRYDAPFNTLSSFASINNGTGNNPAISDNIFLYAGTYTGPVTLLNGQKVIGQRATASLSSVAGVPWPADAGAEPAMGSTAALDVTASGATAVTLANSGSTSVPNNTLRGFNFGNVGATGTALAGTTFGTLIISEVGINTNGRALNLASGTLNGSLTGVTSTGGVNNVLLTTVSTSGTFNFGSGALAGATTSALGISGGAGSFTYTGTITNTAGAFTVQDQNRTGGALSLTGLITAVGKGISVTGAAGSSGTVEMTNTANTVAAAANQTALNVTNTIITANGLKFRSISASGAPNGIVLNNTGSLGGLAVSGTGAAGTGGTIQNTSVSGISLTNTRNASFSWMNLTNANSADGGGAGVCDGSTNAGCNGAIKLNGVTNVTFDRLALSGSAEQGINGINVTRLTLSNSTIAGAGNEINESGLYLFGLFGTTAAGTANSITNTTVTGSGSANHNVFIRNSTASIGGPDRLLIANSSFVNPGSALTPSDGITVSLRTSANFQTVVQNSEFTQATATNGTDGIQVDAGDNSVSDVSITGSTFTGWNQAPINISSAGSGQQRFNVFNNPTITSGVGQGINVIANNNSVARGSITGNTNVSSSNAGNNGVGIALEAGVTSRVIANVSGNTVTGFAYGVRANAREVGSAQLDLTLANNTVTAGGNNAFAGLFAENGNGDNQGTRVCMNLSNNNISKGSNPAAFIDYSMGSYIGSTFQLQGYAGSAGDPTAVQNFVSSRDISGAGVDVTAGTTVNFTSATCATP